MFATYCRERIDSDTSSGSGGGKQKISKVEQDVPEVIDLSSGCLNDSLSQSELPIPDQNPNTDFDYMYASLLFEDINGYTFKNDSSSDNESVSNEAQQNNSGEQVVDLKTILEEMALSISGTSISKFNICRSNIWEGTKRGMRRKSFSPKNKISVKFTDDKGMSEGAVDLGGPMREFLTLVIEWIVNSQLFCGSQSSKLLSCNARCLADSEYFIAGQLFAMSLVHIGVGPRCLSPILFESLVKSPEKVCVSVEDVYDYELRSSLQELKESTTIEEAQRIIASRNLDMVLDLAGAIQVMNSIDDVSKVVNATASWYVLGRMRPALENFKEGLKAFNLLNAMVSNPSTFEPEMCLSVRQIVLADIDALFTVQRSEKGSNRYECENLVISHWQDLLVDIEEDDGSMSYSDILYFATGYKVLPSISFHPHPELHFLHEVEANGKLSRFPKANTCACVLHLPVVHKDYNSFKDDVVLGILNSRGFGIP